MMSRLARVLCVFGHRWDCRTMFLGGKQCSRCGEKRSPVETPQTHFARCVAVGCGNYSWAVEEGVLLARAASQGWAKTPAGWVCSPHVKEWEARGHLAGRNGA